MSLLEDAGVLANASKRRPIIAIVDDDPVALERVRGLLAPTVQVVAFSAIAPTLEWLNRAESLDGAIADLGLPDGSGYELVRTLRSRFPKAELLVLTGRYDPRAINRVQLLGAQYVLKPNFEANVRAFDRRVRSRGESTPSSLDGALAAFLEQVPLTRRERMVLEHSMKGVPRAHLPEVLGVSENTVKTQIRSMLAKAKASNLSDLVWRIREHAGQTPELEHPRPPPSNITPTGG